MKRYFLIKYVSKTTIIFLAVVFLFCGFSQAAQAEEIYVAQNSTGGNTGTNCTNAHAISWLNTASNWATGTDKVSPGDTVHLCGTFTTTLTVQGSGTSGSPITILFEDGAKYSKGSWNGNALDVSGKNYITIDGGINGIIENTANGTAGTAEPVHGIYAVACNNLEIKNLTIRNMYVRTSTSDLRMAWNEANGIYYSGSNIRIHDNVIHDCGAAAIDNFQDGDTNCLFYNNNLYNNAHNCVLASGGDKKAGKFYFYNNHIHDYSNWDSSGCAYHNSALHVWGDDVGGLWSDIQEIWVYNNKFDNPGNCDTAHIFLEGGPQSGDRTPWTGTAGKAYVFNNLAIDSDLQVWVGSGHIISNNTVINGHIKTDGAGVPIIKNNYISGPGNSSDGAPFIDYIGAPNSEVDYNEYAYAHGYNLWCWSAGNCSGSFAAYLTHTSNDHHSIEHSTWDNPPTTGGVDQITGVPASNSDVIDHGVNLTNLGIATLNSDLIGTARPQGSVWDIGAFEYVSSSQPTCNIVGDLDCSSTITVTDIQIAINVYLGLETNSERIQRSDLNNDGKTNILDIQKIINLILNQ